MSSKKHNKTIARDHILESSSEDTSSNLEEINNILVLSLLENNTSCDADTNLPSLVIYNLIFI